MTSQAATAATQIIAKTAMAVQQIRRKERREMPANRPTPRMRKCVSCGKQYDEYSFQVKLKSNNQTYMSLVCRNCAEKDEKEGFIEIIDIKS